MSYRFLAALASCSAVLALSAAAGQHAGTTAAAASQASRYVFTDLGVLGGLDSQARALSGRGQVAGLADSCPDCGFLGFHAFLWSPAVPNGTAGSMIDLGTLAGQEKSVATGVNDSVLVVGESLYPTPGNAFIYDGTMHELGSLAAGSQSTAAGINAAGEVAGSSGTRLGYEHAFLWVPNKPEGTQGKMHDLGTPPGQATTTASAINDSGAVAGSSLNADYLGGRAFVWRPATPNGTTGTMTDLPQPPGVSDSGAAAISNNGLIAGTLITTTGQAHAFVFDTAMQDLGTLPGGTESYAYGINSSGAVVGYSQTAVRGNDHAAIWAGGHVSDLNRFLPGPVQAAGVVLKLAYAINDSGQIAGVAVVNGHDHGFLLTPAR